MKTMRYEELETIEWYVRYGIPALAWAAMFAFFAFAGSVSRDESTPMADAAPALRLMADESAAGPAAALSGPSAREPALRDVAVVAHETLDPVGAGRSPAP